MILGSVVAIIHNKGHWIYSVRQPNNLNVFWFCYFWPQEFPRQQWQYYYLKNNMFIKSVDKSLRCLPQARLVIIGFEFFVILFHLFISLTLLLRDGDIEIIPGPVVTYSESIRMTQRRGSEMKIFHLNVQSIFSKEEQFTLVHDLGRNCNFCFTETWFYFLNPDKERLCCFRTDRISSVGMKTKKVGVIMLLPKIFSPSS